MYEDLLNDVAAQNKKILGRTHESILSNLKDEKIFKNCDIDPTDVLADFCGLTSWEKDYINLLENNN